MEEKEPLGNHAILDLYGCSSGHLDDPVFIRETLIKAINESGCTYVSDKFSEFEPIGVSGFVIIAESHVSIHTWPEHNFAALDVFTCGAVEQLNKLEEKLIEYFQPNKVERSIFKRGTKC